MNWNKVMLLSLIAAIGIHACLLTGCEKSQKSLLVYSGKGLKNAMDEIKQSFEQKHGIGIEIIYAGSNTILSTIKKTRKGDVFIPGSVTYIEEGIDFVENHKFVSRHVPAFCVLADNPKDLKSFDELSKPGVKIAVGNKNMCACGKVTENIFTKSGKGVEFKKNIIITASTVNEMLDLVVQGEVDAALIWADMMKWKTAKDLKIIEIPPAFNQINEIHVSLLRTTTDRESAALFVDFVATEGISIFKKHGFGER